MESIVIVGNASGRSYPNALTTSTVIKMNKSKDLMLVDCGDGVAYEMIQKKLSVEKVRVVIITHSHLDHCSGIVGFIYTFTFSSPKKKLTVIAPNGIERIVKSFFEYSNSELPKEVEFINLSDEGESHLEAFGCNIISIPLQHKDVVGHGIIIQKTDKQQATKTIIFTGDTSDSLPLAQYTNSHQIYPNLLIHECTFIDEDIERAKSYGHSCPLMIVDTLELMKPQKCVLTHFSVRYKKEIIQNFGKELTELTQIQTFIGEQGMEVII